jgi:hypothetical protein
MPCLTTVHFDGMRNSQHWYTIDGATRHGVDLRVARRERLLPSVTSVLKVWPSEALTRWKQEQVIMSAITTPRLPCEADDAFIARVMTFADEEARAAADVGTRRHDLLELIDKGALIAGENPDLRFIQPYIKWFDENVERVLLSAEVVTHPAMGYAGKLDSFYQLKDGRAAVVDAKNRKNPRAYESDAMQLAAYGEIIHADTCISVVLGTQEPSILVREWTPHERHTAWHNFSLALEVWKRSRNYWPERT